MAPSNESSSRADWALEGLRDYERREPQTPDRSWIERVPALSRYRILGILGEGAGSIVYRAQDPDLGRDVALKVPREPLTGLSDEVRERLRREGQVTAGLSHPNVVALYDVGDTGDRIYLVMELVDGQPLSHMMGRSS